MRSCDRCRRLQDQACPGPCNRAKWKECSECQNQNKKPKEWLFWEIPTNLAILFSFEGAFERPVSCFYKATGKTEKFWFLWLITVPRMGTFHKLSLIPHNKDKDVTTDFKKGFAGKMLNGTCSQTERETYRISTTLPETQLSHHDRNTSLTISVEKSCLIVFHSCPLRLKFVNLEDNNTLKGLLFQNSLFTLFGLSWLLAIL